MKKEQLLINLIEDIRAGKRSLNDCLARYPELGRELVELVNIADKISGEPVVPSAEFKRRTRNRLVAVMESTETARRSVRWGINLGFVGRLGYALVAILLALTIGGGTVYASQRSLPGEPLYPVKTGVENIQLALTFSPEPKANLCLKLAERRVQEVVSEATSGTEISAPVLEAITRQMDNALSSINKIQSDEAKTPLLSRFAQTTSSQQAKLEQVIQTAPAPAQPALQQAIDTTRRGNLIAQVSSDNPAFLKSGASVHDEKVEAAYFELEGTFMGVEGKTWNVGGVQVQNVNSAQTVPKVGTSIKLKGFASSKETFVNKVEVQEIAGEETRIKGIFNGTNPEGTEGRVGGISVSGFQNVPSPEKGSQLEVKKNVKDGALTVTQDKTREDRRDNAGNTRDKPVDSRNKPAENQTKPAETKKPVNTESNNTDTKNRPGDSRGNPTDSRNSPGEQKSPDTKDGSGESRDRD